MYNTARVFAGQTGDWGRCYMKNVSIGHSWKRRKKICPAPTTAFEISGRHIPFVGRFVHPYWALDYEFTSGGQYRVRSPQMKWHARRLRTAHLYPPRMPYWEDTRKGRGYRHSAWICFSGGTAAGLDCLVSSRYGYARFADTTGHLGEIIRHAAGLGQQFGEDGFWKVQTALCEAIDLLLRCEHVEKETYRISTAERVPLTSELVQSVVEFLKKYLAEKITLEKIAHHVHVSISSLSHRYRDETGETPMTTLTRLRINHVKVLLLKGYPLKAIAEQLGFSDVFHLSKTFKHVEGIAPKYFVQDYLQPKR